MKEFAGASKKEMGGGLEVEGLEGKKEEAVEKRGFDEDDEEEGGVGR